MRTYFENPGDMEVSIMEGGGDPVEVFRGAAGSRPQVEEYINPAILPMSNTIRANLEFLKGF